MRNRRVWAGAGALAVLVVGAAAVRRRQMRRIASDPEQEALGAALTGRSLQVRSADGTELHIEVFGADQAPTFVLAPGWTESLSYWIYVIRALLSRGFRVVAYDLRGQGDSGPAVGEDYSIARFGEDLEAVLEASLPDGQLAVLAGHSLGAMSIAAWALNHDVSRRARAIALVNTGLGDLLAEELLIPVPWLAQLVARSVPARLTLGSRARLPVVSTPLIDAAIRYAAFGPAASPAQVAFYERMLLASNPRARADIGIALSELELSRALPRLTVPTLVIAGDRDKLTPPSHARRIAAALPRPERLIVLDDTGHMAPLERSREVTDALLELAARAGRSDTVAA